MAQQSEFTAPQYFGVRSPLCRRSPILAHMFEKSIFATIAVVISGLSFLPYIWSIFRGTVRPHVLSWSIWGLTTSIVFFAQRAGGAGVGAWPVGISALLAFSIAVIAYFKRAEIRISATDWLFFVLALLAIPLWAVTHNPVWAVLLVTFVDVLGFGPTIRKAYRQPQTESVLFFSLIVLRNVFVLLALEHYSLTTVLFPSAIGTMAAVVMMTVLLQRQTLARLP